MTGVSTPAPRMPDKTAMPSMPGSMRSRTMQSYPASVAWNRPSRPFATQSTTKPCSRSPLAT